MCATDVGWLNALADYKVRRSKFLFALLGKYVVVFASMPGLVIAINRSIYYYFYCTFALVNSDILTKNKYIYKHTCQNYTGASLFLPPQPSGWLVNLNGINACCAAMQTEYIHTHNLIMVSTTLLFLFLAAILRFWSAHTSTRTSSAPTFCRQNTSKSVEHSSPSIEIVQFSAVVVHIGGGLL